MSRTSRWLLAAAVFVGLAGFSAQSAEAGYLLSFTGNTFPSDPLAVDGHVNFTVLDTSGGTLGDTWGTGLPGFDALFAAGVGSGPLDTTASYLYLFQTVNDGSDALGISNNTVSVTAAFRTSYGSFVGTGFTEATVLTAAGGPYLSGASAAAGDPSGTSLGGAPGVALNGAAVAPTIFPGSGSLAALFFPDLFSGMVSIVWGYTSNTPPTFGTTAIIDGGTSADGTVPTPGVAAVPGPSALALAFSACPALGGMFWLRRRKTPVVAI